MAAVRFSQFKWSKTHPANFSSSEVAVVRPDCDVNTQGALQGV